MPKAGAALLVLACGCQQILGIEPGELRGAGGQGGGGGASGGGGDGGGEPSCAPVPPAGLSVMGGLSVAAAQAVAIDSADGSVVVGGLYLGPAVTIGGQALPDTAGATWGFVARMAADGGVSDVHTIVGTNLQVRNIVARDGTIWLSGSAAAGALDVDMQPIWSDTGQALVFVVELGRVLTWAQVLRGNEELTLNDMVVDAQGRVTVIGDATADIDDGTATIQLTARSAFVARPSALSIDVVAVDQALGNAMSGEGIAEISAAELRVIGNFDGSVSLGGPGLTGTNDIWMATVDANTLAPSALVQITAGISSDLAGDIASAGGRTFISGHFNGQTTIGLNDYTSATGAAIFVAPVDDEGAIGGSLILDGAAGFPSLEVAPNGNVVLVGNFGEEKLTFPPRFGLFSLEGGSGASHAFGLQLDDNLEHVLSFWVLETETEATLGSGVAVDHCGTAAFSAAFGAEFPNVVDDNGTHRLPMSPSGDASALVIVVPTPSSPPARP